MMPLDALIHAGFRRPNFRPRGHSSSETTIHDHLRMGCRAVHSKTFIRV